MISDRYEFDIENLIVELQALKLDRLIAIRKKNKGRFADIRDMKSLYYIDMKDINKILEHIKEYKKSGFIEGDEIVKFD